MSEMKVSDPWVITCNNSNRDLDRDLAIHIVRGRVNELWRGIVIKIHGC